MGYPFSELLESRRLLAAGDPVETFGPGGLRPLPITRGFKAYDMVSLASGRLLVVGGGGKYEGKDLADAIRLKSDFTLDKSFGDAGTIDTFLTRITHAQELPNGKIIAMGVVELPEVVTTSGGLTASHIPLDAYVVRFHADGSLDTTFSRKGYIALGPIEQGKDEEQLAVDGDGNVLLYTSSAIKRLTAHGKPDATFGASGIVTVSSLSPPASLAIRDIETLSSGAILIMALADSSHPAIMRISKTGQLDKFFGSSGFIVQADVDGAASGALELPDGKLLISGERFFDISPGLGGSMTTVTRLNVSGAVDHSFADQGVFIAPRLPRGYGIPGPHMLLEDDGKIVLTGSAPLARLNPDGTLDASFGLPMIFVSPSGSQRGAVWDAHALLFIDSHALLQIHTDGDDVGPFVITGGMLTINGTAQSESISAYFDNETRMATATVAGFSRFFDGTTIARTSIVAGDGDDSVYAGINDCTVDAGAGDDYILGFGFDDTINGGDGNDIIYGGDGNDLIAGGEGADKLFGESDNDTISGNAQKDTVFGGNGNDRLAGNGGRDKLFGGDGDDRLFGGASGDWLFGDNGDDQLSGEGGDDYHQGGAGTDILHGNAGDDRFVSNDGAVDSLFGDGGQDSSVADDIDVVTSIEGTI